MKPDFSQLRDIHMPPPVSWWPPAPGWWLVLALLLITALITYWLVRRHKGNSWRREALAELAHLQGDSEVTMVAQLSVLLRRVAISRYPQAEVASLTGEAWLAFLDETLGEGTPFQSGAGRVLLSGPYATTADVDATALHALAERWIKRVKGGER